MSDMVFLVVCVGVGVGGGKTFQKNQLKHVEGCEGSSGVFEVSLGVDWG